MNEFPIDRAMQNAPLDSAYVNSTTTVDLSTSSDGAFGQMYSSIGRPSIPPEQLLRALLLQILYTIPSERQLMEQLDYNLLFRWFVGLGIDDTVWNHSTFSKNRDRLMDSDISDHFFEQLRDQAGAKGLLSKDHFSVDGTLIDACASMKSFRPKDEDGDDDDDADSGGGRNVARDFKGERRSNQTHESRTDPDARLTKRKGTASRLCYSGHLLTENRNGLIVEAELTHTAGRCERESAMEMVDRIPGTHRVTLAADKGYDTPEFAGDMRSMNVTPHIATTKRTKLDGRTTRHEGYKVSLRARKMVEERFGWMKVVGLMRKLRHRGHAKVKWIFTLTAAACNLVMMRRLMAPT
jgi:transposase